MSLAIRLVPETLRTVAFGAIGAGYSAIGTPLANPCSIFLLQNDTNAGALFSLDGVNDHFFLPSAGFLLFDLTANKTLPQGAFISQGTTVYVKYSAGAPGAGSVYLSVMYGFNGNG
jgi:hypothetical protein